MILRLLTASLLCTAASAQQCIDFSANLTPFSLGARGAGQSFYPEDVAGYAGQSTLNLTELTLYMGNLGGTGHVTTYMAVYDGNPDTANYIGSSTNFIDTTPASGIGQYDELIWTFDHLTLNASTHYWCVTSSTPVDMNPASTVERSLQELDHVSSPLAYRGHAIIRDRDPHNLGLSLRFKACFADSLGVSYCLSSANSTGATGVLQIQGSAAVADNNVTLEASNLPANAFGFFLTSQTQQTTPNPGGSAGTLCLGGSIGRYVGPGQILNSGAAGAFALALDLTQHPQPTGFVSVSAGQTWNFQSWYRDVSGGSATSNFTDGVELAFM